MCTVMVVQYHYVHCFGARRRRGEARIFFPILKIAICNVKKKSSPGAHIYAMPSTLDTMFSIHLHRDLILVSSSTDNTNRLRFISRN